MLKRWLVPTVQRGYADWTGKFIRIAAPPAISQWFGRGEIGLQLFRRTERQRMQILNWTV